MPESLENQPTPNTAEWLYDCHKTDLEAARQLGWLAFAGTAEPEGQMGPRANYIYKYSSGGDVQVAAHNAKNEIKRVSKQAGEIVSENLDYFIQQAREDMEWDKIKQIQKKRPLVSPKHIYEERRKRGIDFDLVTGKTVDVLPPEHYSHPNYHRNY
jgi:hypothetical protein